MVYRFVFSFVFDIIYSMKIIHCADIHIDFKEMKGLEADERKLKRNQVLQNFFDLVQYAETNGVNAILLCGDIFDVPSPSKNSVNLFKKVVLSHSNIKFFYIWGNHDENFCPFNEDEMPKNFILFKENFSKFDLDENVTIGGASLSRYVHNLFYTSLDFDKNRFNILMLHQPINATDEYFNGVYTNNLQGRNIDYLALGHIHARQAGKIDNRGMWQYSGCLEGKSFNDAVKIGEKKGFYLLEIDGRNFKQEFIPFSKYDYRKIELTITPDINHFMLIGRVEEIASKLSKTDLVKIIIKGKHTEDNPVQVELIKQNLYGKFFYLDIVDETSTLYDFESYKEDKLSLKSEFLKEVFESKLSDLEKEKIATIGLSALKGEDILL